MKQAPGWLFGATILTSAFLLFEVQPMLARLILPWFGGTAGVWTTCMLFYQVVLLAGYAGAHWLSARPPKVQAAVYIALALLSTLSLPIFPAPGLKPTPGAEPIRGILQVLGATVGLPYLLLASTSPLLQSWYVRTRGSAVPWRFFALSNLGSLSGLLAYPFLIEPRWAGATQIRTWSWLYGGVVLACSALAAWLVLSARVKAEEPPAAAIAARGGRWLWAGLSACGSALLLAMTGHMTQNLAPVPLLWVLPLTLYLFSFILCFDSDFWYQRAFWVRAALVSLGALAYSSLRETITIPSLWLLLAPAACALFSVLMVIHGELARSRPQKARLTEFYLMTSVGGAVGGLLIGIGAPLLLPAMYDLPIALTAAVVLLLGIFLRHPKEPFRAPSAQESSLVLSLAGLAALIGLARQGLASFADREWFTLPWDTALAWLVGATITASLLYWSRHWDSRVPTGMLAAALALVVAGQLTWAVWKPTRGARMATRNFYAPLSVTEDNVDSGAKILSLRNGTIVHGAQLLQPERHREPTTYYGRHSGVGLAVQTMGAAGPVKVGVIGLGAGTMAAYAREGDDYVFYEINPAVITAATTYFTFLGESKANIQIVRGDARLSLEREVPRDYDVLAVDAFSGDAVPVHLLTEQALDLYWRHLKPNGVLALHVSSRYLKLAAIAGLTGKRFGPLMVLDQADQSDADFESEWLLYTSHPEVIRATRKALIPVPQVPGLRSWTDDFSSVAGIVGK